MQSLQVLLECLRKVVLQGRQALFSGDEVFLHLAINVLNVLSKLTLQLRLRSFDGLQGVLHRLRQLALLLLDLLCQLRQILLKFSCTLFLGSAPSLKLFLEHLEIFAQFLFELRQAVGQGIVRFLDLLLQVLDVTPDFRPIRFELVTEELLLLLLQSIQGIQGVLQNNRFIVVLFGARFDGLCDLLQFRRQPSIDFLQGRLQLLPQLRKLLLNSGRMADVQILPSLGHFLLELSIQLLLERL
mmetsp:Transcript_76719/g.167611  ORF Transcript_76719/g.167611 Transcript_76719/m.167611 type:complete len:242 (+) Transcript_76719:410-1135(+)